MARIAAPIQTPPRVGLLATLGGARRVEDASNPATDDGRWNSPEGFAYSPSPCDGSGIADPCDVGSLSYSDDGAQVAGQPFLVYATARCSTFDSIEDRNARALQSLAACESKQIANELWTGTQAQASSWDTPYLASSDSDELSVSPVGYTASLACLEQYLAECSCGGQGMIHATRQLATFWNTQGLLRREGNLLLTGLDTLVVADAGYDGSGPQGQPAEDGSVWAYASSMVGVRLDASHLIGGDKAGVNRSTNTILVRAQRYAAYTFDPCCLGAIAVDLDLCDIGPEGS